MCFVNAALQLLVHVPPFLNRLRDIGHLMGYQTGGGTTVLVDATFRLLDEFVHKDRPSLTQQSMQLTERGKARENGKMKEGDGLDSFLPTYVYDAIKEKKQFKNMLVRPCASEAPFVTDLCWPIGCRMDGSRMQKGFSASTWTRSTKSWSRARHRGWESETL
jgi:hypothetical protein